VSRLKATALCKGQSLIRNPLEALAQFIGAPSLASLFCFLNVSTTSGAIERYRKIKSRPYHNCRLNP